MPDHRSPFYPPRAPWYAPAREAGHTALAATRVHRIPTPGKMGLWEFALGLVIPGYAFAIHGRRKIGVALVIAWPILVTLGLAFLGQTSGNILLGLAISLHAISIIHLLGPWLKELEVPLRILAAVAAAAGLIVFAYLPLQELAHRNLFMPIATDSGVVVVRPTRSPLGIDRDDWIVYWGSRSRGILVIIQEGTSFGPVIALPGETVEFTPSFLLVNGKARPRQEGMPTDGSVTVPDGHWFVWPRFRHIQTGNVDDETIRHAILDHSLVPHENLRGTPYTRWFHREQVLATP